MTDDGTEVVTQLAHQLTAQGWQIVVLSFPEIIGIRRNPLPRNTPRITLSTLKEDHLKQKLDDIVEQYGAIAAFLHLHPALSPAHHKLLRHEPEKAILKHVFLIAKYIKRSLTEASQTGHPFFLTVTRLDGELGIRGESGVISGGLFGLVKTLNQEWPNVFCRAVDIAPDWSVESTAQTILDELHDPNRVLTEVGYGSRGRVTLGFEEHSANQLPVPSKHPINETSIFLVSGGGKGITAQCVIQLARYTHCKFILLGRSALMSEPDWAQGCEDEIELRRRAIAALTAEGQKLTPVTIQKVVKAILSQREIQVTLHGIQRAGGLAEYLSVDLTDSRGLQEQLSLIQRFGSITGIIHGAGNLADKRIENKSEQDFELVYTTKINGLQTLLHSIEASQLKHLVLFSSAAGFYGNIGQSDYAIANEILNKFAYRFQHDYPECEVISFNWGPWDSGMVTPELKQIFAQRNIDVIPTEIGTQIFVYRMLTHPSQTPQVLVGSPFTSIPEPLTPELRTFHIHRKLTLAANPFLQDHKIGNHVVLPITCSVTWIANICEQLYPGYTLTGVNDHRVFKGIIFDESLADEYCLKLEEIDKSQADAVILKSTIWSQTSTGKLRYHYGSTITLQTKIPGHEFPIYPSLDLTVDSTLLTRSPYQDGTLFHGVTFQGIKQILNLTPQTMTLECIFPELPEQHLGQFFSPSINPVALDIQYQSLLIWVRQVYQAASLPLSCERGEHFQNPPPGIPFYVSMNVQTSTPTKLIADVVACDAQGHIYNRIVGAEVTISQQLNRLFMDTKAVEVIP